MSEKIKPFKSQNQYTTFENVIIDCLLPKISPNAWKCLTLIIRKTVGWHKDRDKISFSQIKDGTGIKNNGTVSKALKDLEDLDLIVVIRSDDQWATNIYLLNKDYEIEISGTKIVPDEASSGTEIALESSTKIVPSLVRKSYTQKKEFKETPKDSTTTGDIHKLYQDNINPLPGQIEIDDLNDYIDTYPAEWVEYAIKTAARANKKTIRYIGGILKNIKANGGNLEYQSNGGKQNGASRSSKSSTNGNRAKGSDLDKQESFNPYTGESVAPRVS